MLRLVRHYPHPRSEVWAAFATPGRMARCFAEVTGELREGSRYQATGKASGRITGCGPPRRIEATREHDGAVSRVVLDFAEEGAGTRVTLTHRARIGDMPPGFWERFGPGATGAGWERGLLGLALHLNAPEAARPDGNRLHLTPGGAAFLRAGAEGWGQAAEAAGIPAGQARAMPAACHAFSTGTG